MRANYLARRYQGLHVKQANKQNKGIKIPNPGTDSKIAMQKKITTQH